MGLVKMSFTKLVSLFSTYKKLNCPLPSITTDYYDREVHQGPKRVNIGRIFNVLNKHNGTGLQDTTDISTAHRSSGAQQLGDLPTGNFQHSSRPM